MKAEGFVKEDEYNLLGNFYITLFFFSVIVTSDENCSYFFHQESKIKIMCC